jgi:hypothetical protein
LTILVNPQILHPVTWTWSVHFPQRPSSRAASFSQGHSVISLTHSHTIRQPVLLHPSTRHLVMLLLQVLEQEFLLRSLPSPASHWTTDSTCSLLLSPVTEEQRGLAYGWRGGHFEIGTCYVVLADLEFAIFLPQPPESCDYRHVYQASSQRGTFCPSSRALSSHTMSPFCSASLMVTRPSTSGRSL